jgi:hypothetical protein
MTPPTVARNTATIAEPHETTSSSGKKNNTKYRNSRGKPGKSKANNMSEEEEGGHARRARAVGEAIGGVLFMDPGARAVGGLVGGIGAKLDAWGARRRKNREAREAALVAGEAEADELALAGSKRAWEARQQSFKSGAPSSGSLPDESALSWRNEQKQQGGETSDADRKSRSSGDDIGGGGGGNNANNNSNSKKTKQVARPKSTRAPLHQNPRRRPNSNASKSSAGSATTDTTERSDYSNLTPLSSIQSKPSGQRIGTSLDDVSVAGTNDGAAPSQGPLRRGAPEAAGQRNRSRSLDSALGTRPEKGAR